MSFELPSSIIWIITGRCNLNCKHCYTTVYRTEKELPKEKVFKILEDAAELGVKHVHYTGGEPLLVKHIFDFLSYAKDLGMEASLFTNLTLLGSKIAEKLYKLEARVYASIDGPNREIYEKIRGQGTWDRMLKGIHALIKAGILPHINIAITELNWKQVRETITFSLALGAYSVSIIPSMPTGAALKNKVYVSPSHYREAILQAAEIAEELRTPISVWCTPFLEAITNSPYLFYGNCRKWDVIDITPSGRIVLCDILNIEVAKIDSELKNAYLEMLNNPLYNRVVYPQLKPPCTSCSLSSKCTGGCYARAYIVNGELNSPDPLCPKTASFYKPRF